MVADHAVMLMLAVSRNLMASDRGVRAGHWYQPLVGKRSYEMEDKVVGIVGLGHIGRQVAQRVQGFGCRVHTTVTTRFRRRTSALLTCAPSACQSCSLPLTLFHCMYPSRP